MILIRGGVRQVVSTDPGWSGEGGHPRVREAQVGLYLLAGREGEHAPLMLT